MYCVLPIQNKKRILATTEKHKAIRDVADEQYLKNTTTMKKKYAKQKNVQTFSVGDSVSVKVPRIDRTSTDISRIACVVVEVVNKDLYRLRCKSGVLSVCFSSGDLEAFSGHFEIPLQGWQVVPRITLRSASMEQSPSNVTTEVRCNCRFCNNKRCACKRAGMACSTSCHKGKTCNNKDSIVEAVKEHCEQEKKESKQKSEVECKKRQSVVERSVQSEQCQCRRGCHSKKMCPCKKNGTFCTKKCHPQHHCVNFMSQEQGSKIDLTDETSLSCGRSNDEACLWQNCYGIKLLKTHKEAITAGEWLCDEVINATQLLLKNQHPNIGGFQSTLLANILAMDPQGNREFVQILNVQNNHWILISTVGCPPSTINVYDSMHLSLSPRLKKLVADLMQSPSEKIVIRYRDVQWQSGGSDCGLFALAFATSLCLGIDPVSVTFVQSEMRPHLLFCIEKQVMSMFPYKHRNSNLKTTSNRTELLPVYCTCRLPDDGSKMVECCSCLEWYHVDCVPRFNEDAQWFCIKCI